MNRTLLFALITPLVLAACTPVNDNPKQVAHKYWSAMISGDVDTARRLVSNQSRLKFDAYLAAPDESKAELNHVELDDEFASVKSVLNPAGSSAADNHAFNTILVLEKGHWKIDAARTQIPAPKTPSEKQLEELAEKLNQSMQKNIESIDEAMSESMKMLNDALRQGSSEMGESMLKGMEELNRKMRESIDTMKQRRQRDNTINKDEGEGMI